MPDVDSTPASVGGVWDNIAPLSTELGTNLCKEIWIYSSTAHGCVKLTGTLTRRFKTTDPNNAGTAAAKQDLDLDYLNYKTGLVFGDIAGSLIYKFA